MKITDISVTTVDLGALEVPFWNAIVRTTRQGAARLEIRTDEGLAGMAPCSGSTARRAMLLGQMKEKLIGEDPMRIGYLWHKLYMGRRRKPVAKGDYIGAMSAIDIALWDLLGKALGQPVWKLMGGTQARVRAYAAGGYYADGKGLAELGDELAGYAAEGFRAVKMKVGWPGVTLREDAKRVQTAREAIGPDVDLMVDANNAWDAATARRFARLIEPYEPYWFEEPVVADDYRGGAMLVQALDIPIASGENEYTRWGARDLIEAHAADIIQLDPNICGGLSEWLKVAAMASAYHLPVAPHGNPNVGACCVAAVENGLITENYPTSFNNPVMGPVDFRSDGYIYLEDTPGLGIGWDEATLKDRGTTYR